MEPSQPLMRWHGGKWRLYPWLQQFFPPHECYVDAYGGAANVLARKERSYAEVYNDLDGQVVNVFRVLQDARLREQLIEACAMTPFSRDEFVLSFEGCDDQVEQARRTLFRSEAGFGSGGSTGHRTGFRSDSRRAYSLAAHIWQRYPDRIASFGERFAGVIVENRPALDVIAANDGAETLHYIDPPYLLGERRLSGPGQHVYRHEMTDDEHVELLAALQGVEGSVVISGYRSTLYDDLLAGWERHETRSRISSGRGTAVRVEAVWLNPRCAAARHNRGLFE